MKGYEKDLDTIDWNTPDYEMLKQLQKNAWQFSAAKTYTQLRDMSKELIGPDGKIRSWENFKLKVGNLSGKHLTWLKTEYDTAIAGAQMAAKWAEIQRTKERFPLLEFDAVMDGRTSDGCKSLNKVIKPVDDPFWDRYYPPNHFKCRSTVRQLKEGKITPDDKVKHPDVPVMFQVNLGKQGLIFPEGHAYYTDMPKEVYQEARRYFPYDLQFDILEQDGKGIVRQHFLVKKDHDYPRLIAIANKKARERVMIDVMPTLNPNKYSDLRKVIFPDAKDGTSPDLRVNKILVEEEGVTNAKNNNTISSAIRSGKDQADYLIISLNKWRTESDLIRIANGRFKIHRDLKEIEFRHEGKHLLLKNPFIKKAD